MYERFLKKTRNRVNKILIPFLVKQKMYHLLSLLMIFNLKKIKKILPKNKSKFKTIVLTKTGGIEDLIESQKNNNNNILYLSCSRQFFKLIFSTIFHGKKHNLSDGKYFSKIKEIENLKLKYRFFLVSFLKILKKKYNFNTFVGFNFNYLAERELHAACDELKIPFLLLYKESIHAKIQEDYYVYSHKKVNEKFDGYKVAVYSDYAKKLLANSKIIDKSKIEVVGCSRLGLSYDYKKILPKKQILYYAIQSNRGLPNMYIKTFGKAFFNNLKKHKTYNGKYNWKSLHIKTLKILKEFAINNPNISIIIKIKIGGDNESNEYKDLPKNIKVYRVGAGHTFLKDAKVVIAWNTTSILEAMAANRFVLLPYFYKKTKLFRDTELKLGLKKSSYGLNKDDFYKKLNLFIKMKYNKNIINNNLQPLKYYLGNKDNKSGLRLNKFLKDNLNYKNELKKNKT
jgi:hypothetical protein